MDYSIVITIVVLCLLCQASERRAGTVLAMNIGLTVLMVAYISLLISNLVVTHSQNDVIVALTQGGATVAAGILVWTMGSWLKHFKVNLRSTPINRFAIWAVLCSLAQNLTPVSAQGVVNATAGSPQKTSELIVGSLPLLFIGVAAVGPWVRRSLRDTAERLGILPLHMRWWIPAIVLGLILVPVGDLLAGIVGHFTPADCLGQQQAIAHNLAAPRPWLAQLGIAAAAGTSEETLFRGALQPRFGIFWSSLLWASFHLQYTCHGFPSLANVYILGLGFLLGLVRNRFGLVSAILVHTTYDGIILLATS